MAKLTALQISQLNDAAARVANGTASPEDTKNVSYATKSLGYKAPAQSNSDIDGTFSAAVSKVAPAGYNSDALINAYQTGDWSGVTDASGKPLSDAAQQAALTKATADLAPPNAAMQAKDVADAQSTLAQDQGNYQDYLNTSATNFQADKTTLDQNAADNGVLFSGGRVQKQNNLQNSYSQDQATKLRNATSAINGTASDLQYKYGAAPANNLSQYYQLGSNSYNAGQAQGGATQNGLSSVYNTNQYNYQGTQNAANSAAAQTRAAGMLWNQGNKLVATGNQNQYK